MMDSDQVNEEITLLCDICGLECYLESYFIESSEEDYCPKCYKNSQYHDVEGEHRVKGVYSFIKGGRTHVTEALVEVITQIEVEGEYMQRYPDIFESSRCGHVDSCRFHIERCKVDANSVDWGGNTPLHLACMLRHVDLIKYLLDKGADTKSRDSLNKVAFDHIRSISLRKDIEKWAWYCTPEGRLALKRETVDSENSVEPTHIWSAAFKGDITKIRQFLSMDAALCNAKDKRGNTPVNPRNERNYISFITIIIASYT